MAPSGLRLVCFVFEWSREYCLPLARLFYSIRPGLFFPSGRGFMECTHNPTPQGCRLWSDEYRSTVCITLPSGKLYVDRTKSATACAAVRASLALNKDSNDLSCKCSPITHLRVLKLMMLSKGP